MCPTYTRLLLNQIRDASAYITKKRRVFRWARLLFILKQDAQIGIRDELGVRAYCILRVGPKTCIE
jgi:hypothetical protein